MKKRHYFLFALLVLCFTGCALMDYYRACKNDPVCAAQAKSNQEKGEILTSTGVSLIPHPAARAGAGIVGKIAGYGILFASLLIGGYGLKKKKED